jgi:hypothetical protein
MLLLLIAMPPLGVFVRQPSGFLWSPLAATKNNPMPSIGYSLPSASHWALVPISAIRGIPPFVVLHPNYKVQRIIAIFLLATVVP